jgi:squalene-associated FAD-dependent desaturase
VQAAIVRQGVVAMALVWDVIVIGGGLSGMAAAHTLATAGQRVLLLERNGWLGGRAAAVPGHMAPAFHIYLGCCRSYIGFMQRLGVPLPHADGLRLSVCIEKHTGKLVANQWTPPLHLANSFIRYPFLTIGDKLAVLRGLNALVREPLPPADETFAEWLNRHRQPLRAKKYFWEMISMPALNAPTDQVAAHLALIVFRLAVLGNQQASSISIPPSFSEHIQPALVTALKRCASELQLNAFVQRIAPAANGYRVELANGKQTNTRKLVIALPPSDIVHLLADTLPVPATLRKAAAIPHCGILDVLLVYDRPVCLHPVLVIPGIPAVWIFPQSATSSGNQAIHVSVSCPGELIRTPATQAGQWVANYLAKHLRLPSDARLQDVHVRRHLRATFLPNPTYQPWRPGPQIGLPGLFVAGDWTNTGWPSTMEGAVRSGEAAAQACLSECKDAI